MANKLRRRLARVVDKDLHFIDENDNRVLGTWISISNEEQNKHFFVPYDGSSPFRISLNGKNRVYLDYKNQAIYGLSESYLRAANDSELWSLAEVEDWLALSDPLSEIQGTRAPNLIKRNYQEQTKGDFSNNLGQGFSVGF